MMIMPANNSGHYVKSMARQFPGRIGWLQGPSSWKKPIGSIPYALDNDCYMAWRDHRNWSETNWLKMLERSAACEWKPLWVLCPDSVADKEGTLERWHKYHSVIVEFGFKPAFALQDGMIPKDVPSNACLVFIGGTTFWKWRNLPLFTKHFKRVHVGRVNSLRRIWTCEDHGIESIDGTGWFRGTVNGKQGRDLLRWLNGHGQKPMELPLFGLNNP